MEVNPEITKHISNIKGNNNDGEYSPLTAM
jgi:hypothetical protein